MEVTSRNVRGEILSYLQSVYDSTAETLPDVKDGTCEPDEDASVELLKDVATCDQDDYAVSLAKLQQVSAFKDSKKKTNQRKRSVTILRKDGEVRYLPPGSMKEYWEQLNCQRESQKPISFAFFWRVWYQEFAFMKFRSHSNHAVCSTCLRHKLLIRELSSHLLARKEQVKRYHGHLRDQYLDRMTYWSLRGESRLRGGASVTAIIDSMDQSKTCLPRGACMKSKELSNMQRPKMHLTAVIIHGFSIFLFLSEHDQAKNSSSMIEMMSYSLTMLSKHCLLKHLSVNIQSDNTVREMKNNPFAKWMGSLVSHGATLVLSPACCIFPLLTVDFFFALFSALILISL
ncbi:cofG [Symbiodinium necroappetens]|uniref:CofG protein n=1 Tax=Symbiodinium necroappetens TaxID=1628268 RepID=A0A812TDL2_9DINO|nr:cofG [Symbiodinium necroappetens]